MPGDVVALTSLVDQLSDLVGMGISAEEVARLSAPDRMALHNPDRTILLVSSSH